MKKIPVGATIAHAYRFAFGSGITILGAIWVALAIQIALSFLLVHRMAGFMTAIMARDPSAAGQFGPLLLIYPFVLIVFFVQTTAVTELALNPERPARHFYFPLGKPVWRMVGAFILAALAIAAIILAFIVAGFVLAFLLRVAGLPKTATAIAFFLGLLAGYCGLIYIACRFYFLLAPVTIAEARISVGRAWHLAKGNFWRIFLIVLAVLVPVMIAEYALIFAAIGLPPVLPHGTGAEAMQILQQEKLAWNMAIFTAMEKYWFVSVPFMIVLIVFWLGASCGAQVFAYQKLIEDEGLAPVAGD